MSGVAYWKMSRGDVYSTSNLFGGSPKERGRGLNAQVVKEDDDAEADEQWSYVGSKDTPLILKHDRS